jgi:cytidylate kinase
MANLTETAELDVIARQRMEHWLLSSELRDYLQRSGDVHKAKETGPFIALSRQMGSSGGRIAQLVSEQLGWDLLDRAILDIMAERYGMPRDMLDIVDEKKANWVHDVLGTFIDPLVVTRDQYVAHVQRIICLAALHGKVVFVGRSAQSILPRKKGLAVRIIAPKDSRIEHVMQRRQLTRSQAAAIVDKSDADRKDFCHRYFHYNIDDPLQYDLVLNTARFLPEQAADTIVRTFRHVEQSS